MHQSSNDEEMEAEANEPAQEPPQTSTQDVDVLKQSKSSIPKKGGLDLGKGVKKANEPCNTSNVHILLSAVPQIILLIKRDKPNDWGVIVVLKRIRLKANTLDRI